MFSYNIYSDGSIKNITDDLNLYFVLHEYQQSIYNYRPQCWPLGKPKPRTGEPEVVTTYSSGSFVTLNEAWQDYWFALLTRGSMGTMTNSQLISAWANLTVDGRAFTDHHAYNDGYADYIQKVHLDKSPIGFNPLTCGGNVVSIDETDYFFRYGDTYYRVQTLDPINDDPPDINKVNPDVTPYLVHWATNASIIQLDDGTWEVDQFPQLGGTLGVPFPFMAKGKNYIAASKIVKITDGKIPNPYHQSV
jgi:hypothetical protein